ncbi:FMN-binding negative transcriptional regulator [Labrys monachus]|uniref:Transcriptional regulator n=1 Tax=Labrys monachus TaxID=217067 RepID=A0ABU0FHR9_9HYPH|nr:FMN-binding negative transcriptional regulator [Labrys monachus]MDQ0394144.1 transcriptional regulator [Labrys monachus]
MYQPPHFREENRDVLHALMRAHPLATLVTKAGDSLDANHVPMLLDPGRGSHGVLQAHIARGNDLVARHDPSFEVLAIFQGADAYITPSWYETKRQTGKVVPTWNYVTVHVHGRLTLIEDPAWLRVQIAALTKAHEGARTAPWHVDDAPEAFIQSQIKGIVGLEIEITRLEGKWKVSQNRPDADRAGVVDGLAAQGDGAMAGLVAAGKR